MIRLRWPTRPLELWHPDSPGTRVVVTRRWPRYLWTPGPVESDHIPGHYQPSAFATNTEVLRMYRDRDRVEEARRHATP